MPIYTRYDRQARRYEFQCAGTIRLSEFLDVQRRMAADPDFHEAESILGDLRNATYRFSAEEMDLLCSNAPTLLDDRRLAYVVEPGQKSGLLKRYLDGLGVRGAARVFPEVQAAVAWLSTAALGLFLGQRYRPILAVRVALGSTALDTALTIVQAIQTYT